MVHRYGSVPECFIPIAKTEWAPEWNLQVRLYHSKARFGLSVLKFNFHHINVSLNAGSTKCRLIAYMLAQIRSNLRDESIKPN
jgi:hypothetical protein